MENGETLQQAAARESQEEALAKVEIGSLLAVVHVLHAQQVHVFFRAALPQAAFRRRARRAWRWRCSRQAEIPWDELAFPSTDFALRRYFEDRAAGSEAHHFTDHRAALKPRRELTSWPPRSHALVAQCAPAYRRLG